MSLPHKYQSRRHACECARAPTDSISFHDLNSRLYKAAKTMLPTEDYHYDHVSVLMAYWPVGDYQTSVMPDLENLRAVLEQKYGFHVQKYAIPHTHPSPQAALASRVVNFVEEGDDRRRHLKIVFYAGDMDAASKPPLGQPTDGVWTIDWARIRRDLRSAWMCDILLLLDSYVIPFTWGTVDENGDNVVEAISRDIIPHYSFTIALSYAFRDLAVLFWFKQLPVFTTGLLLNGLLDWCQRWSGGNALDRGDVPVYRVLKQDPDQPRAIQLQPLCNHDAYNFDERYCSRLSPPQSGSSRATPPRVPSWLLCGSPVSRLEVALTDTELVVDDLLNGESPWGYWLRHFPALKCCIHVDVEHLVRRLYLDRPTLRDFVVIHVPAALAAMLAPEPIPAVERWDFAKAPSRCIHQPRPLAFDAELQLDREDDADTYKAELERVQAHYDSLLDSVNSILRMASSKISFKDMGPRDHQTKEEFACLGEEVDKIDEKVDPYDMRQVDLAWSIHNIYQNARDYGLPCAIDMSWLRADPSDDWDMPTVRHVEDRDADGWTADDDFFARAPRVPPPSVYEEMRGPPEFCDGRFMFFDDASTWAVVGDERQTQPESEMWW